MWLWILATTVAFFIKGLCGFANSLVFSSILSFGENNVNISPVELIVGYPSNMIMTWHNRKDLKAKVFLPLSIMVLAGSIPGAFLLKNANSQYIKVFFGIIIILIAIEMYTREKGMFVLKENKLVLSVIGIFSGLLCGIFGIGAPLAAYVNRVTSSSNEFKANISAVFVIENTFRIIFYSIIGVITFESLKMALYMVPFMLLGLFAGIKSSDYINEKTAKYLVIILLIISGIMLIIKNL